MTGAVLAALLSHWRRRPLQLLTLVLGLALATALWSGVQAINAEARKSYREASEVLGGGGLSEIVPVSGGPIPVDTYVRLRRSGWLVSPVIDGWLPAGKGRVRLIGVDPYTAPPGSVAAGALAGGDTAAGFGREHRIFATPATAARLDEFGDLVSAVDGLAPGVAVADIALASELTGSAGYSRLLVHPDQPLRQPPLAEIAPELRIEPPESADDLGRLTDSFHLNLTAFGLLAFAVGLFIVNGAVGLAFEQRRAVFRTLRALGVTAGQLVLFLSIELLVFALVAGAIGILLGYLIAAALLPDVAATLRGLYGATVEGTLTLSPVWWLSGCVIAALGTALASATALLRIARLQPLAPAKPRAWVMASDRSMRHQLLLAAICLAAALAANSFAHGLVVGFVLLGGLLLSAAFALPALLAFCLSLAAKTARGPVAAWFWADTRQQLPGLSLALMALLLALAANIGVGTMVKSFRLTFTGWLDQRLVSELYVTAETEADVPGLLDFLEARSEAILPIWHAETEILGAPAEIYGVANHPVYRENWPILASSSGMWERLYAGEGALVNEQLARREGLEPGDDLPLPGWATQVLGVYSDYGNPHGQAVISIPRLEEHFPEADRTDFGVLLPEEDLGALKSALIAEFGLPEDNLIDQSALKAVSLSVFERTFAVTGALNILTLSVAGVAILTSLLTLAAMRLPQLAPVWALGLTRRTLGRLELVRALILAALTFFLSIPVGLLLAWVLLSVINAEAFGWQLPMHIFPADWLVLGALSLAAAGLASLWPARRLATRPPADLIRVFAHER